MYNMYRRWGDKGAPSGTAKQIVHNVHEFMALEKKAGQSMLRMKVVEHVAKACQLSTCLLYTSDAADE